MPVRNLVWISHHMAEAIRPEAAPLTIADSAEYAPTQGVRSTTKNAQMNPPRKARTGVALRQAVANTPTVSARTSIGNMSAPTVIAAAV